MPMEGHLRMMPRGFQLAHENGSIMSIPTTAHFPFTESLRGALRREQLAIEAAPLMIELIHSRPTLARYADVLVRWYRVISAIQPGADRVLGISSPEMSWLESDLARLGRIPCARWTDSPDFSMPESLGYRFVIESQHLRSRVIVPVLRHVLGPRCESFAFFTAHAGDTTSWRSTTARLDAIEPQQRRDVLIGARATLVAIERTLSP
jgi:hypothetical protein